MLICDECGWKNEDLFKYYVTLGDRVNKKIFTNCFVKHYDVLPPYFEQFIDTKDGDINVEKMTIEKTLHIC